MHAYDTVMSQAGKIRKRPLSPHLQVYRLPMTALMSISHRATGYGMAVGTLMVVWLLVAAASGDDAYNTFQWFVNTLLGKALLVGWSVALFYHMANGVRHLVWDTGAALTLDGARKAGLVVLAATVVMTALFWWAVCGGAS